jgi:hypothetical protein
MDDRDAVSTSLPDLPALDAGPRVLERLLVRALSYRHAFHADSEPRVVHHGEHVLEATILLADEIADRALLVAIGKHAGRTRVYAQLVLDGDAADIVALPRGSVRLQQELRDDEERNALHAFRRVRRPGENEVHDVLGHVVLAPGDENLGALDAVMIAFAHRPRSHRGQVGAGLRLGEIHGARTTHRK